MLLVQIIIRLLISTVEGRGMGIATVNCNMCGVGMELDTKYFRVFGEEPFCRDCLVHTRCRECNDGLRLQPSKYQDLGGDPVVCASCGGGSSRERSGGTQRTSESTTTTVENRSSSTSSKGRTFWAGLTPGEKVVFPLAILLLGFLLLGLARVEANGGTADAGIWPAFLLIIIVWTYWRGRKNR